MKSINLGAMTFYALVFVETQSY